MMHVSIKHKRVSTPYFKAYQAGRAFGLSMSAAEVYAHGVVVKKFSIFTDHYAPRGGETTVIIYDDPRTECGIGVAQCSMEDSFCYKTGTMVALKNAIVNGSVDPSEWIPLARAYGEEYVGSVLLAQYDKKCSTQHS